MVACGGIPVLDLLGQGGGSVERLKQEIERDIRYANITIIEGTGASQYGIWRYRRGWRRRCCATSARCCR